MGFVTWKKTVPKLPPPGGGLVTVIKAVLGVAILAAGTMAVNSAPLTNVVVRATPFQFTTELLTNPAPFTVSVNCAPPGATAVGTSG